MRSGLIIEARAPVELLRTRTRTRTNTHSCDTEASAAGKGVRACVAFIAAQLTTSWGNPGCRTGVWSPYAGQMLMGLAWEQGAGIYFLVGERGLMLHMPMADMFHAAI